MEKQKIILLVINIVGGTAVIGSYVFGLRAQAGGAGVLWGGVPDGLRPVFAGSMIVSALGYFAVLHFILFRLEAERVLVAGRLHFSLFSAIFLVILIPSAFWMPLTNLYIGHSGIGTWIAVLAVLVLVGLASVSLFWTLLSLKTQNQGVAYRLAVVGSGYFAFHTAILDAVVWAVLFGQ